MIKASGQLGEGRRGRGEGASNNSQNSSSSSALPDANTSLSNGRAAAPPTFRQLLWIFLGRTPSVWRALEEGGACMRACVCAPGGGAAAFPTTRTGSPVGAQVSVAPRAGRARR